MKTREEIAAIADGIIERNIFIETYLPEGMTSLVFLSLGYIRNQEKLNEKGVFLIYQHMSESIGEMMGYPIFPSFLWLNRDETVVLQELLKEKIDATETEGNESN